MMKNTLGIEILIVAGIAMKGETSRAVRVADPVCSPLWHSVFFGDEGRGWLEDVMERIVWKVVVVHFD